MKTNLINTLKRWYKNIRMSERDKYLSKSNDLADLERRQRELDRRQFNGGNFKSLYNRFYL